jgi:5-methylcytosine-specific restriction endonuclease McrA
MPRAYLCPGCGALHAKQGRCARCKREQERARYQTEPIRGLRGDRRWKRARAAARRRDGNRCQSCGAGARLEIHHILPLEQGGDPYALSNLVTLCASCHRQQSTAHSSMN